MKKRTPAERERIETLRADRIALAKNRCEWCDKKGSELHHVFSRKSEYIETVRFLCAFCHRGGGYQARLNVMKIEASTELIEKYGVDEARKMAGGRLYFKKNI